MYCFSLKTYFNHYPSQFLSDKDPGESIIRPSSRGPSYLTLTLKIYDGVFAHKDIVEGGKEHKDITSLLRIGKTLKIGEDTFEDLDEVSLYNDHYYQCLDWGWHDIALLF